MLGPDLKVQAAAVMQRHIHLLKVWDKIGKNLNLCWLPNMEILIFSIFNVLMKLSSISSYW